MTVPEPELPQVVVRRKRGPSVVWIVPMVAALVAGWIWWRVAQEQGPTIAIRFETAAGLEAGKTAVKLRDVTVGQVVRIDFEEDLSGVVVRAAMNDAAEDFLLDSTRFWVVRPRVGAGGVQGLETLVSGAYIAMEPGSTGEPVLAFDGLEEPPVSPVDAPGLKLTLASERLGGLTPGSPVLFRDLEVGTVERTHVLPGDEGVEIDIYLREGYRDRVFENTRFWNAGGVQVSMGAQGLDVQMESLTALLTGGVAFDTFDEPGARATSGDRFLLLDGRGEAENVHLDVLDVTFVFRESVRGLAAGAPVEFMGMEVGRVVDFELVYDARAQSFLVPVRAELHEQIARVVSAPQGFTDDPGEQLDLLVEAGLRARLNTASLITGSLYVQLELLPNEAPRLSGLEGVVREIPTLPSTAEELTRTVQRLPEIAESLANTAAAVEQLVTGPEIEGLVADVQTVVADLGELSSEVSGYAPELIERVDRITAQAEATLDALNRSERSLSAGAARALDELSSTLRSVRLLADLLERHPEALLRGKEDP